MIKKVAFYHCHTPLHIGSGTTLDIIDLPIQREVHTDFPVIPSTAIKGVIRTEYWNDRISKVKEENKEKCLIKKPTELVNIPEKPDECNNFFEKVCKYKQEGKETLDKDCKEFLKKEMENFCKEFFEIFGYGDKEGDIIFTDGKILLFPVKSVKGVFAWITCPLVLERFERDTQKKFSSIPNIEKNKAIAGKDITINSKYLVLEELSFEAEYNEKVLEYIKNLLPENLRKEIPASKIAILSNDMFKYFVKNHTEVNARTRIDQATGTVKEGALWYEELVPAETVFYNLILSRTDNKNNLKQISDFIKNHNQNLFQFGGDETLGRGLTRVSILEG